MRYKTEYSLLATLIDHDGTDVRSTKVYQLADGFACIDDSVLNYSELPFADECDLRRGFPRIVLNEKGRLYVSVEVDSKRQLSAAELRKLKADFAGQLTDGIGAGCFDAISAATGISVQLKTPLMATCKQQEGDAWKPIKSTGKGNERRIAAIQKQLDVKDIGTNRANRHLPKSKSKPPPFTKLRSPIFRSCFACFRRLIESLFLSRLRLNWRQSEAISANYPPVLFHPATSVNPNS